MKLLVGTLLGISLSTVAGIAPVAHGAEPAPAHRGSVMFVAVNEALVPERFRLSDHQFDYEQSEARRAAGIMTSKVTFPSPVTTVHPRNNTVHCEYFAPTVEEPSPGVVVLHILGGDFELSRICCRTMASNGIAALFVKMPYYGPRRQPDVPARLISADLEQTTLRMTQAVLDIRRAAAWLASRPEVDRDRLGITGISLGGVVSALAAAAEPRFGKACLVLAGGDMARVVIESKELDQIRLHWKDRDVTPEQVAQMLGPIDPLTYADRLRDRELLMINAKYDEVIPRECTLSLWRAAGEPELVWWNAGHYSAAIYLPAGLARITKFFNPGQIQPTSNQGD
jgi:dienelactone hydrolase